MDLNLSLFQEELTTERKKLQLATAFKDKTAKADTYKAGGKNAKVKKDGQGDPNFDENEHKRDENGMFIQTGDSGAEVRAVGAALGERSLSNQFDDNMETAVRNYQQDNGLLVDGIVGQQTAGALLGKDGENINPGEIKESQKKALVKQMRTSNATKKRRAEKKKD